MQKQTKNGSPARRVGRSLHPKRFVRIGLIVTVLMLLLVWGNTNLVLTNYELSAVGLPDAFDGMTVVHLSDLHNAKFGKGQERLLSTVRESNADMIVITGDTVDSRHPNVQLAVDTVAALQKIAPVYLVTGNHEARLPKEMTASFLHGAETVGATVLRDAAVNRECGGANLRIAAADDLGFYVAAHGAAEGARLFREKLKELTDTEDFTLLLAHRPELSAWYAETRANIVFCGHAHGGQVRLPWLGGIVAPGQGLFPKLTAGAHEFGQLTMVISRGLGNSVIPLRINNPPEVVTVTLRCSE